MQMNIFEIVYARIQLVLIEKILWRGTEASGGTATLGWQRRTFRSSLSEPLSAFSHARITTPTNFTPS
jgi:hypothetical protein